jgi:dolichyl-phosphate-mannose-protein mannosyltransferase
VADVSLPLARSHVEPVRTETRARERFLTLPRAAAVGVFVLFALSFDDGHVSDDGTVYFNFLRRFFGAHNAAVAYQFGSSVWNSPFYLASQLAAARGGLDRFHAGEVSVNAASNVAVLVSLYLGWRILRELDLPRGPAVIMLTLFGTPLYYYGVLSPSYKHAADALYATALMWFALRASRLEARRRDLVAAGVCMGLELVTRYANIALIFGIAVVYVAYGLRRRVAWMLGTAVAVVAVLLVLPVIRHIPYAAPPNIYAVDYEAFGVTRIVDPVLHHSSFSPTVPFKMLFTLRRGLFVFTPLTAFATVGFVLLARRDRRHRPFLVALGVAALALVAVHCFWARDWYGGGSFSSRFLTALFPFFLVGTAEAVRYAPRILLPVLTLCAIWSLWIGLVQFNGYYNATGGDSIVRIVDNFKSIRGKPTTRFHKPPPDDSLQNFGRQMADRITERWQLYWRLVS